MFTKEGLRDNFTPNKRICQKGTSKNAFVEEGNPNLNDSSWVIKAEKFGRKPNHLRAL